MVDSLACVGQRHPMTILELQELQQKSNFGEDHPTNIFWLCGIGFPAGSGGIVAAGVAT